MTMPQDHGGLTTTTTGLLTSDPLLLTITITSILSFLFYTLCIVRPRTKGGAQGPPIVTSSPISKVPIIGTIIEFGISPVKMVQRCYDMYGPVFTVPVSFIYFCGVVWIAMTKNNDVAPVCK